MAHFDSIAKARIRARRILPRAVFEFVDGGAEDELTLRANRAAFAAVRLLPKPLVDVRVRDQSCRLPWARLAQPVAIAPTGFAGILWPRGELAAARAAAAAGTVYIVSHGSTVALEELADAAPGALWFQLFLYRDRAVTARLCERAQAAGYSALVVTIDNQVSGNRERDRRNGFSIPPRLRPQSLLDAALHPGWLLRMMRGGSLTAANYRAEGGGSILQAGQRISALLDPGATFEDLAWLRRRWGGPLVVKGVMHPEGARKVAALGVDAIVVSNHGGRQLDGQPATIEMLPRIAEALGDRLPLLLDGGVERGTDVLKALALGARAVLIGRAHLWGLAVGGEAGVGRVLAILREEVDRALALGGWPRASDLGQADLFQPAAGTSPLEAPAGLREAG